jgi:hypothetical protein
MFSANLLWRVERGLTLAIVVDVTLVRNGIGGHPGGWSRYTDVSVSVTGSRMPHRNRTAERSNRPAPGVVSRK